MCIWICMYEFVSDYILAFVDSYTSIFMHTTDQCNFNIFSMGKFECRHLYACFDGGMFAVKEHVQFGKNDVCSHDRVMLCVILCKCIGVCVCIKMCMH